MTKTEFLDSYNNISDLMDFIDDNELWDDFGDIYSEADKDALVDEGVREFTGRWWGLKDKLDDVPCDEGYYFYEGGYFDFRPLTDWDVSDIQNRICDAASDYIFDPEDPEEEPEVVTEASKFEFEEITFDDELEFEDEDEDGNDSIGLFYACSGLVQVIE